MAWRPKPTNGTAADLFGRLWLALWLGQRGASIVPTKDHIDWPYVVLLVGLVVMVAAAFHLLSAWAAFVIFAVLWIGFAIGPKGHR